MIYTIGSWLDHYDFHHSDVSTAWHFADACIANGRPATVLWPGPQTQVHGVPHVPVLDAQLLAEDTIVVFGSSWRAALEVDVTYAHLQVPNRKWWYAYDFAGGEYLGERWSGIIIENNVRLSRLEGQQAPAAVHYMMPGVVHDPWGGLDGASPYPRQKRGELPLFFAGRLMCDPHTYPGSQMDTLQRMAHALPTNYHIYLVSASVTVPRNTPGAQKFNIQPDGGATLHLVGGPKVLPLLASGEHSIDPEAGCAIMSELLGRPDRITFLGPKPYQSFWSYYKWAFACIDFGFQRPVPPPNCKILDPLRTGTPIVADGYSSSFSLLQKYGGGIVVPYRDAEAMACAIQSLRPETASERQERAQQVLDNESWHVRLKQFLEVHEIS